MENKPDTSQFPKLTTTRLRLRQLTHADATAMIAIFGDEQVLRYLAEPPVDTRQKAIEMIDWLNLEYETKGVPQWGITLHASEAVIGMCGVYNWDHTHHHIDLAYHIVPAEWGKGYATEAAKAMVGWCFSKPDIHRIQADITEGHLASERVLIKCGFTVEGVWRESCWTHESFVNIKQFGLLRREYIPV